MRALAWLGAGMLATSSLGADAACAAKTAAAWKLLGLDVANPTGTDVAGLGIIKPAEGWSGYPVVSCTASAFEISGQGDYNLYKKNVCNIAGPPGAGDDWTRLSEMVDMRNFGSSTNCTGRPYCQGCVCTYALNGLNGVFTFEDLTGGGFVLYILGVVYMFLALAIVCDEFFVPALDVLVEKLGISNDVAGATFMAAGGSAPELFTALIGTFAESSVGFGTIVGSAVFNVLFVIAMCALFSGDTLELTWWPLARDCSYYALSLGVLAMFFGGVADIPTEYQSDVCKNGVKPQKSAIWWYESSILLLMYVGYVIVMKFNEKMRLRLDKSLDLVASIDSPRLSVMEEKNPTLADERPGKVEVSVEKGDGNSQKKNRARTGFAGFRAGMLTMLLDSRQVNSAAIAALHRIKGDVKETFDKLDQSHDGYIDKAELASLLEGLGLNMQGQKDDGVDQMLLDISEVATQWDGTRPNEVSLGEFTDWYVKSEQRVEGELSAAFSRCDADGNGLLNREEVEAVMKKMGNELSKTEFNTAFTDLDLDHSGDVSVEEFSKWYKESAFFEERHQLQQQEVEEEEGVSLSIPEGTAAKVKFFIILPLLLFMSFTMPDVRKDKNKRYFLATFIMAILHIGIYSWFMVWWATDIGCAFGIPDEVMGLTFLAAGTSVPDLLTSVIVAKQGHGDMAVSSSIGSNIFDVLVGLPFPWLIFSMYKSSADPPEGGFKGGPGAYVNVAAPTLFLSLIILFAMIALVIVTIMINGWKLTKTLGITMIGFYVCFVAQDLSRQFAWPDALYDQTADCPAED